MKINITVRAHIIGDFMKFIVSKADARKFKTDIISIGCFERPREDAGEAKRPVLVKHSDGGISLDKAMGGAISKQIAAEKFLGERGSTRVLFTAGKIPAKFVMLIGLGPREKCTLEVLRETGAIMARAAEDLKASSVALVLERGPIEEESAPERARAIAEGVLLGGYRFDRYKTGKNKTPPAHESTFFLYQGDAAPVKAAIEHGRIVSEATLFARDLVNISPIDKVPAKLSDMVRAAASESGFGCTVMGRQAIAKANMNGLLAVASGSSEPQFIVLKYRPREKPRARVAFIGKGITFDAGGISIKSPKGMENMKHDMAGAASAIAAMGAISKIGAQVEVTAYIPLCENLPDGEAARPGDVITMRNGKTVEIVSTDAEGRLLVADAISYAADQKPDAIVDLATLTGGAPYCCGELYALVLGNDQKIIDKLKRAAELAGEPMWQLPMVEYYMKGYTSGIADLNNTGKSKAQTILGALFLNEFVGKTPWAHLDIAACAWTDEDLPLAPKGGTGTMVRTLVNFALSFKKSVPE